MLDIILHLLGPIGSPKFFQFTDGNRLMLLQLSSDGQRESRAKVGRKGKDLFLSLNYFGEAGAPCLDAAEHYFLLQ